MKYLLLLVVMILLMAVVAPTMAANNGLDCNTWVYAPDTVPCKVGKTNYEVLYYTYMVCGKAAACDECTNRKNCARAHTIQFKNLDCAELVLYGDSWQTAAGCCGKTVPDGTTGGTG